MHLRCQRYLSPIINSYYSTVRLLTKSSNYKIINTGNGLKYKVRTYQPDQKTIKEAHEEGIYDHTKIPLKDCKVIIDVGAYIGDYTIHAANIARQGTVYAFEPHPTNFDLLKDNIELNSLTNVKPYKIALSDTTGETKFSVSQYFATSGSIITHEPKDNFLVDTLSFEDFVEQENLEYIDVLKLDIEGSEYPLLYNSPKVINKIRSITMEYHDFRNAPSNYNHKALVKFFKEHDFEVEYSEKNNILQDMIGTGNLFAINSNNHPRSSNN